VHVWEEGLPQGQLAQGIVRLPSGSASCLGEFSHCAWLLLENL